MPEITSVTCFLGPVHDLYHLSSVLTGLSELAFSGEIRLRYEPAPRDGRAPLESAAMRAMAAKGRESLKIAFDLYDRSDRFEAGLLDECDVYFKRSYYAPDVPSSKVVPFGLNYACRSSAGEAYLAEAERLGLSESFSRYRSVRPFEAFEQTAEAPVDQSVVFQTRAWAPESTSDDAEAVNEPRARLIRALRTAFPGRFQGGFAPGGFARQRYPDLLTDYATEPGEYLKAMKRHLVGVSTRGLHGSEPFKLAEYMAGSMAVVSEPLRNGLAAGVVEGQDFLTFREPDECTEQCSRILGDPDLAAHLRERSRRYYLSEVRPAAHVRSLLARAFAQSRENPGAPK